MEESNPMLSLSQAAQALRILWSLNQIMSKWTMIVVSIVCLYSILKTDSYSMITFELVLY